MKTAVGKTLCASGGRKRPELMASIPIETTAEDSEKLSMWLVFNPLWIELVERCVSAKRRLATGEVLQR